MHIFNVIIHVCYIKNSEVGVRDVKFENQVLDLFITKDILKWITLYVPYATECSWNYSQNDENFVLLNDFDLNMVSLAVVSK